MIYRNNNNFKNIKGRLPTIDELSTEIPAISEYLDAFRLPQIFKQAESDTIPVIDINDNIIGIVSEYDLAKVLPEWSLEENSYRHKILVKDIMTKEVWTEPEYTNVEYILSGVHRTHIRVIPIVDNKGRYTGKSITRTTLIAYLTRMVKPRSIGGLATPLGVYMTDGLHQAGPGNLGLILTGMSFGLFAVIIEIFINLFLNVIPVNLNFSTLIIIIQISLFVIFIKLTPFSKIHAAEHQTIHAIEKGLPLTIDTVRMQPRPHKRCGTNLMILITGILFVIFSISDVAIFKDPVIKFIYTVIAFLFVFKYWRKVGMWLQEYLTTSEASNSQIENGIKVGEELIKKHKEDISPKQPDLFSKLWNIGIVQILAGFLFVQWISEFIFRHL